MNSSLSFSSTRPRRAVVFAGLALGSLLFSPVGFAGPGEVDDTDTAEVGHFELESGIEYEQAADGRETVIAPAITYGLVDGVEVELGLDYAFESADGEPDTETFLPAAQFKAKFWKSTDGSRSLGFKGKIAFPMRMRGPADAEDPEGYARLLFTEEHGAWQFDANLGYGYHGAWHRDDDDKVTAGVDVRYRVTPRCQVMLETVAERGDHPDAHVTGLVNLGTKYSMTDRMKLECLVGTGVGRESVQLRLVSTLKWEF